MDKSIDDIIMKLPFTINGYELQKMIGKGAFAGVFKTKQISSGHIFAAKVIHCRESQVKRYEAIQSEIDCMMRLLHPNVIKIYDRFKEDEFLFLIIEYCNNGSIEDFIRNKYKFSDVQYIKIIKQILTAINYCHCNGIAHRDIKPANIFITNQGTIKVGDFGLGMYVKENETISNFNGSFCFKAPELILKKEHNPFLADIWSLGVTFYYILTKRLPWRHTKEEITEDILTANFTIPKSVSPEIAEIINKMIVVDPSKRAPASKLLKSEIFETVKINFTPFESKVNPNIPRCFRTKKMLVSSKNFGKYAPRYSLPALKGIKLKDAKQNSEIKLKEEIKSETIEKRVSVLKRNKTISVLFS